jgi:hypothetical protein
MAADDDTARPDACELPTRIVVPFGIKRVSVNTAIERVIAVADVLGKLPQGPSYQIYSTGILNAEGREEVRMIERTGRDYALYLAKVGFVDVCKKLCITPRNPYGPHDYKAAAQNAYYTITVDEWARLATAYGVPFEVEPIPQAHEPLATSELASDAAAGTPSRKPMQRQAAQEARILEVIRTLGYDPLVLPPFKQGKKGVKTEVRAICEQDVSLFPPKQKDKRGGRTFPLAWERMLKRKDLKYRVDAGGIPQTEV